MRTLKKRSKIVFTSSYVDAPGNPVRQHLAEALIGKTVDLLNGRAVAHGVVSGVMLLAGVPKLLVNGRAYDLNQVLTASPA